VKEEEPAHTPRVHQRRDISGRRPEEVVVDAVLAMKPKPYPFANLNPLARDTGFHPTTLHKAARRLIQDGTLFDAGRGNITDQKPGG